MQDLVSPSPFEDLQNIILHVGIKDYLLIYWKLQEMFSGALPPTQSSWSTLTNATQSNSDWFSLLSQDD